MNSTPTNYRQSTGVQATNVENVIVLTDTASHGCFGTNKVGRRIWECLSEPRSEGAIVEILLTEFEVSREDCVAQVASFIEQMKAKKLVEVTSADS